MRVFLAALGLVMITTSGHAAFSSIEPGLGSFTVDFTDDGTANLGASSTFDGIVKATASGNDWHDQLTQTGGAGLGVGPDAFGLGDEVDNVLGFSESITLTFLVPFKLESVGIANAGDDGLFFGGPTGIVVNGSSFESSELFDTPTADASDPHNKTSTLLYAGDTLAPNTTLTFSSQKNDSFSIAGVTGQVVPLPAAAWLFIGGLAGIGGYVRYGRRRVAV